LSPQDVELRRMLQRSAAVASVDAELSERMGRLVQELSRWLGSLAGWGARDGVVHGDCKPSQFLIGGSTVALLDFDHCGIADPATDVGTFLATLRQQATALALTTGDGSSDQGPRGELERLFLDEYCRAAGEGAGFAMRALWYEALAFLRKAQRAFARSTRSPVTAALLDEGFAHLGLIGHREST
jgi:aminoglycoside phosphotransferase (APT) family kinase protein